MKITRRTAGIIAGLTAAAVCVTGATAAAAPSAADHAKTVKTAPAKPAPNAAEDGKAVFKGLFFGQGKVGAELAKSPLFSEMRAELATSDAKDSARVAQVVTDAVDAKHPGFFASFAKKVRSGDPRKVESAVNDAQAKLLSIAKKADAKDTAQPVQNGQMCGTFVAVAGAVVHIAAAVTAAAAAVTVTVAVGANFVKAKNWFWSVAPKGDDTALGHDEAVATVTKILKTA
ncbi:sporulation delaying protein family toxin [Streptomyces triculaminicus]|uniref:sporulation delaying protein family toxin n=1 Tax=Streptomyces triculaminicus TaxID=2816232 RepID=UPI0033DA8B7B